MGGTATVLTGLAAIAGGGSAAIAGIKAKERADEQAEETERRTEYEQERIADEAERLKGRQRAAFAASGMRVDEGSPLAVIEETQREAEREIKEVGKRGAYFSDIARTEGRDLRLSYFSRAGGSLLTGAGKTAEMWDTYGLGGSPQGKTRPVYRRDRGR